MFPKNRQANGWIKSPTLPSPLQGEESRRISLTLEKILGLVIIFCVLMPPPAHATSWFSWGKKKDTSVVLGTPDTSAPQTYDTHKPMAAPRAGAWGSPTDDKSLNATDRAYLVRRATIQANELRAVRAQEQRAAETRRLAVAAAAAQMAARGKPAIPANNGVAARRPATPTPSRGTMATTPQPSTPAIPTYRSPTVPVQDWENITKGAQNPPAAAPSEPIKPIIIPNPNLRKKAGDTPANPGK